MCCNGKIDIFPLIKCNSSKGGGATGPTGPTGPAGQKGKQGPAGPNGTLGIAFEFLTYAGSTLPISTTVNTTFITNNCCDDASFTLADGDENDVKYIYLKNSTLPIQITTSLGSFNLSPTNPKIQLFFKDNQWIQISDKSSWFVTTLEATLVGDDVIGTKPLQGSSVALSADGNTLAVGGIGDGTEGEGATWVFTRSGSVWTQQAKLVGAGAETGRQDQGNSVALSADGNTLIVGAPFCDTSGGDCSGATFVFVRSSGAWSQQAALAGT